MPFTPVAMSRLLASRQTALRQSSSSFFLGSRAGALGYQHIQITMISLVQEFLTERVVSFIMSYSNVILSAKAKKLRLKQADVGLGTQHSCGL